MPFEDSLTQVLPGTPERALTGEFPRRRRSDPDAYPAPDPDAPPTHRDTGGHAVMTAQAQQQLSLEVQQHQIAVQRQVHELRLQFMVTTRRQLTRESFVDEIAAAARICVLEGDFKSAAPLYKLAGESLGATRGENHLHLHPGGNQRFAAMTDDQLQAILAQPVSIDATPADVAQDARGPGLTCPR